MPEKQTRKNQAELNSKITPLLIAGNDRLTPYIQVFSHQPENVTQHALGTLFGIFKIDDTGVDSAFIVNFLVSELKKEYYGNPRRTPAGSFEAGLNRINIALSELAKQGNIAWIGKLESAVCALEKNGMLHFSVTGPSHIALLREGSLSLISDGLAPESETPNPLKTFMEISSGKLHPEDLVILGTHELFEFLPKEKMERSAKHFSYEEFTRFLHTALINEFDFCATITLALEKKSIIRTAKKPTVSESVSPDSIPNLWGATAFRKSQKNQIDTHENEAPSYETPLSSEAKQTGHLYIQQQSTGTDAPRQELKETFLILKEHLANVLDEQWMSAKNTFRQWRRTIAKKIASSKGKPEKHPDNIQETILPPQETPPLRKEEAPLEKKETPPAVYGAPPKRITPLPKRDIISNVPKKSITEKLQKEPTIPVPNYHIPVQEVSEISPFQEFASRLGEYYKALRLKETLQTLGKNIVPFFQSARTFFQSLFSRSYRQTLSFLRFSLTRFQSLPLKWRLGTLCILVALLVLPFFFFSTRDTKIVKEIPPQETTPAKPEVSSQETPISEEKNVSTPTKETLTTLYSSQNTIQKTFLVNDTTLLLVEDRAIVLVPEKEALQTFPFPQGGSNVVSATYMKDLSLLFILTQKGSILSFSPISKKFSENNLSLGDTSVGHIFIGSYLTYLYIANIDANTILRYPRAEGGFGSPTPWLSADSGISLAKANDMTIDGSIYFSKPDGILRLTNKKEDPLTLEKTSIPATFGSVFTTSNTEDITVTDTQNNRVLLFGKNGALKKQTALPTEAPHIIFSLSINEKTPLFQSEHALMRLGE